MGAHGVARCGNLRKKLRPGIAAPSLETAGLHSALETPALRSASADATAHERRLRGDGFGDGFGGDFLLVGRSTGGDSAPGLASTAPSEVGSLGSLRQRVAGSSPGLASSIGAPGGLFALPLRLPLRLWTGVNSAQTPSEKPPRDAWFPYWPLVVTIFGCRGRWFKSTRPDAWKSGTRDRPKNWGPR